MLSWVEQNVEINYDYINIQDNVKLFATLFSSLKDTKTKKNPSNCITYFKHNEADSLLRFYFLSFVNKYIPTEKQ